jgi:hypothetical protein
MEVRRVGSGLLLASLLVAVVASCRISRRDLSDCDTVVTRCSTVCDTWCDSWGCYPICYDDCWDDCYVSPPPPSATVVPPPTPPTDGGTEAGSEGGASLLCTPCRSSDECAGGGLCLVPGGEAGAADAGTGFCGQSCTGSGTASDCPEGFACSAIGAGRQCLPTSGTCP